MCVPKGAALILCMHKELLVTRKTLTFVHPAFVTQMESVKLRSNHVLLPTIATLTVSVIQPTVRVVRLPLPMAECARATRTVVVFMACVAPVFVFLTNLRLVSPSTLVMTQEFVMKEPETVQPQSGSTIPLVLILICVLLSIIVLQEHVSAERQQAVKPPLISVKDLELVSHQQENVLIPALREIVVMTTTHVPQAIFADQENVSGHLSLVSQAGGVVLEIAMFSEIFQLSPLLCRHPLKLLPKFGGQCVLHQLKEFLWRFLQDLLAVLILEIKTNWFSTSAKEQRQLVNYSIIDQLVTNISL